MRLSQLGWIRGNAPAPDAPVLWHRPLQWEGSPGAICLPCQPHTRHALSAMERMTGGESRWYIPIYTYYILLSFIPSHVGLQIMTKWQKLFSPETRQVRQLEATHGNPWGNHPLPSRQSTKSAKGRPISSDKMTSFGRIHTGWWLSLPL